MQTSNHYTPSIEYHVLLTACKHVPPSPPSFGIKGSYLTLQLSCLLRKVTYFYFPGKVTFKEEISNICEKVSQNLVLGPLGEGVPLNSTFANSVGSCNVSFCGPKQGYSNIILPHQYLGTPKHTRQVSTPIAESSFLAKTPKKCAKTGFYYWFKNRIFRPI